MTSSQSIYCPIRKEPVAALPEEIVRQRILSYMISSLGFPVSLIVVEKALRLLPHLQAEDRLHVPDRRADIICFAKGIHPGRELYPLLTVECKAIPLTKRVIGQVAGYNHFVKAYYIAVVNQESIKTGWFDPVKGEYVFVDYLPPYDELIAGILKNFHTKTQRITKVHKEGKDGWGSGM